MKYIITGSYDYADEFDYPIFSVISKNKRDFYLAEENQHLFDSPESEYGFGTNESLEFSGSDIKDMIEDAQVITEEELEVLFKFNMFGMNIIDSFEQNIYWTLDEESEDKAEDFQKMVDAL